MKKHSAVAARFRPVSHDSLLLEVEQLLERELSRPPCNCVTDYCGCNNAARISRARNLLLAVKELRGYDAMYDDVTSTLLFRANRKLFRYSPATSKWGVVGQQPWYNSKGPEDAVRRALGLRRGTFDPRPRADETPEQHLVRLRDFQESKGFKPGWVGYNFKAAWGRWPDESASDV